jgi:hypothetical protein
MSALGWVIALAVVARLLTAWAFRAWQSLNTRITAAGDAANIALLSRGIWLGLCVIAGTLAQVIAIIWGLILLIAMIVHLCVNPSIY